ncbi:hypothetical protein K8Z49_23335 [Actinomadura madurae]|uniref:hypothetical protein n=1 Tax=Actinomadura madurae TaxID=1993 RepID=UPI00399AA913
MTAPTYHNAENDAGSVLRTARWQLPGGHAATGQVRRKVHDALRRWGLGPAAGDLTDHLTALVHEFLTRAATRARGPIDLRLEFRASARLLLSEIHSLSSGPAERGHQGCDDTGGSGVVALTYGQRGSRNGIRYIHSFTWWRPDSVPAAR